MARQKKSARGSTQKMGASLVARPPFPLKIEHSRIFALAAEADAAETHAKSRFSPPSSSKSEDPTQVFEEQLRDIRAEVVPAVPSEASYKDAIVQMIREEFVAVLPNLIREAIGHIATLSAAPSGPSPAERTKAWIAEELNALAVGLNAVAPPDYLDDNRKLSDRLFLHAANTGRLFGVTPLQFFDLLSGEVRDFVFRISNKQSSRSFAAPGDSTLVSLETLHSSLQETATQPPLEIHALDFMPTPLLALRHSSDLARFGEVLAKLERQSKTVAAYYRLRIFAGRADDEIAALVTKPKIEITERLDDFIRLLEDDLVATGH